MQSKVATFTKVNELCVLLGILITISHPKNIDFLFSNPRFNTFSGGQFNLKYFLVIFLDLFGYVLFL